VKCSVRYKAHRGIPHMRVTYRPLHPDCKCEFSAAPSVGRFQAQAHRGLLFCLSDLTSSKYLRYLTSHVSFPPTVLPYGNLPDMTLLHFTQYKIRRKPQHRPVVPPRSRLFTPIKDSVIRLALIRLLLISCPTKAPLGLRYPLHGICIIADVRFAASRSP
jgi:hypothetical protein